LNEQEKHQVRDLILVNGRLNPKIVGQPVAKLAEMAGVEKAKLELCLLVEFGS
jgi:acetaldehyde dehydrogenase/alcohol dehydrogenase